MYNETQRMYKTGLQADPPCGFDTFLANAKNTQSPGFSGTFIIYPPITNRPFTLLPRIYKSPSLPL